MGWVGGESEVVEDVADEVGLADVREDGAGSSAGTGEDVVEIRRWRSEALHERHAPVSAPARAEDVFCQRAISVTNKR